MVHCSNTNCAFKLKDDWNYCPNCGRNSRRKSSIAVQEVLEKTIICDPYINTRHLDALKKQLRKELPSLDELDRQLLWFLTQQVSDIDPYVWEDANVLITGKQIRVTLISGQRLNHCEIFLNNEDEVDRGKMVEFKWKKKSSRFMILSGISAMIDTIRDKFSKKKDELPQGPQPSDRAS